MQVKPLMVLLFICIFNPGAIADPDPGACSLKKRDIKELTNQFGEHYELEAVRLSDVADSLSVLLHNSDCLFMVFQEGEIAGYVFSTQAKGRFDYFDYTVTYSRDLAILSVIITAYRSTHGAGISQKKWLNHFVGYNGGNLELGKEIDAVSGGTISSESLVEGIKRCQQIVMMLKRDGTMR